MDHGGSHDVSDVSLNSDHLFTMRSKNTPHGKFYKVVSPVEISEENAVTATLLPQRARGHMVLVLGWADRWNWVKVATVSILVMLPYSANR